MKFTLTLSQKDIKKSYAAVLQKTAQNATIKGFRPGKAPLDVVEAHTDQSKIYEQVLNQLLFPAYNSYLKKHDLHPITAPKVSLKEATPDKDWVVEIEIAEKPTVTLGDYQSPIKALGGKSKIHLPENSTPPKDYESEQLNQIFDILLKTSKVTVPSMIIDEEVNHRLSHLVYQIDKLGLDLNSYTASINKTTDQIKAEYAKEAEAALKLEFILEAIADQEKLHADQKEIDTFIQKIDDVKVKTEITQNKAKKENLVVALTKRKVTDYLLSLTTSPIILAK